MHVYCPRKPYLDVHPLHYHNVPLSFWTKKTTIHGASHEHSIKRIMCDIDINIEKPMHSRFMSVSLFMNLPIDVQHKPVQVPHALKVHEHLLATKNNPLRWYGCYAEVPHNGRDFISDGEVDIYGGSAVRPDVAAEQAAGHGEASHFLPKFRRCHLHRRPRISTRNRSESLRTKTKPTSFFGGAVSARGTLR